MERKGWGSILQTSRDMTFFSIVYNIILAFSGFKTKDGVKEHWYCEGCDCYFTDAEGKYNIAYKSLIVPAIETPATGDSIMLWVVLAVVSVMGMACVVVLNKKKYNA